MHCGNDRFLILALYDDVISDANHAILPSLYLRWRHLRRTTAISSGRRDKVCHNRLPLKEALNVLLQEIVGIRHPLVLA